MNDALSTLIAFVGFLIVFSMMIQAIQEGAKNLFKLKSSVWVRFFRNIYETQFFLASADKKKIHPQGQIGDFDVRFRQIKEVITNAEKHVADLRKALLEIAALQHDAPDYARKVDEIWTRFERAALEFTGLRLDAVLNIYNRYKNLDITNLIEALNQFMSAYSNPRMIDADNREEFLKASQLLVNAATEIERAVTIYRIQLENRMDAWIAQLEEEYRANMLKWTLIIGALFVLLFNADSFGIYRYLSHNANARQKMEQLGVSTAGRIQNSGPDELNSIIEGLRITSTATVTPDPLHTRLNAFATTLATDFKTYDDKTTEDEILALRTQMTASMDAQNTQENKRKVQQTYADSLSKYYLKLQGKSMSTAMDQLRSCDLPLGWVDDWAAFTASSCEQRPILVLRKLGGLALTWFLITFGAPFWNDVLSALVGIKNVSLRK